MWGTRTIGPNGKGPVRTWPTITHIKLTKSQRSKQTPRNLGGLLYAKAVFLGVRNDMNPTAGDCG